MNIEDIKKKIEQNVHICSKCVEERVWNDRHCPECGSPYYYPYYPDAPILNRKAAQ